MISNLTDFFKKGTSTIPSIQPTKPQVGGFNVSLPENLKGLKRGDTGEVIPKEQFTSEMMTTYRDLLKQHNKYWEQQRLGIKTEKKPFGERFLETTAKIGEFMPGKELAKGLGLSMRFKREEKEQEEILEQEREFQDIIFKKLREAKDVKTKDRYRKMLQQSKITEPTLMEETIEEMPTTKQVIASSAELALLAGLGYKPYLSGFGKTLKPVSQVSIKGLKVLKAGTQAQKLVKAGLAKKALVTIAKPIAREAVIGAGFFGTMEATKRDSTISDIVRASEKGALISGAFTAGSLVLGKGLMLAQRHLKPKVLAKLQGTMISLEKAAAGKPVVPKGQKQLDLTLSYIGETKTIKQKVSGVGLKVIGQARKFKTRWVDRFAPGARIEQRIAQATGRPLKESEKIYRDMRLLTSVSDAKAERMVGDLMKEVNKYPGAKDKAIAWMTQLDFIDRARLGQKVAGGQSLDDLVRGLEQLAKEIGPDDMVKVSKIRQAVQGHSHKLLDLRVRSGLISEQTKNVLLKTHPNYIPHNVIMDLDDRVAQGLSQSLNVSKTDIMKAVGSARNIKNPLIATGQRTQIATRTIEKNNLLNNFVKVQEQHNLFPGMKQITTGVKSPDGFGTINLFRGGAKETWQVPADIAVAVRNLDTPLTPGWFKVLTTPQKVLKKGATQYNLSFTLPNKLRDKQTAYLTSGSFIDDLQKRYGLAPNPIDVSKMSSKQIKDLYKISGGYGSSIFREGESKILRSFEKQGIARKMSSGANPVKVIDNINEFVEQSTRLEVFKKGLKRGLTAKDAAFVARDASIDFAKMGTWMKPVNQAVPFLNARVQGFINLPKAFIASPEAFARMQLYTAVYPTMALHQHNRRYESYKNVSQYFKNRYWVIMINETDTIDSYTGEQIKVPQFITLPKGEGQQLVSGPIQYYLEKSDGVDYRKTSEMLVDVVGSASPLEFQQFDQANWLTTTVSQLGPVATIATGLGFGKHPYFGTPIVPESREKAEPYMQFKKTTPEITKEVGKILDYSPAKIDFIISSFGGLPQDLQRSVDIIYNVVRDGKIGGNSISETPLGVATQIPISRRFVREAGEFYGPEMEFRKGQKEEITREVETEKLKAKDRINEIYSEMIKKETPEEKQSYLHSLGNELTPEVLNKIKEIKNYRQTVEVLKKSDSVEIRARYIFQRLNEMDNKKEKQKYLLDLAETKLLTKDVIKRIAELKQ